MIGTAAPNRTCTSIRSPPPYVSPLDGLLVICTKSTNGAVAVAPFTLWAAFAVKARAPKESWAEAPPGPDIVPPPSVSAAAATPIPSASTSPLRTVYANRTARSRTRSMAACRAAAPIVSASRGDPVTVSTALNSTSTRTTSPAP